MSGTIPLAPPGTGMISSASPFVAPDFTPTPLSFRFLFELWKDLGNHEQRIATLEAKMGVTDGSDATAGQIGEYLSATGSGSLSTGVATDLATLTLPAGDWDVAGSATFGPSTQMQGAEVWIGPTAATPQDPGRTLVSSISGGAGTLSGMAEIAGPLRYSIAAPSTLAVHLGVMATFTTGTVTAVSWIRARRIR